MASSATTSTKILLTIQRFAVWGMIPAATVYSLHRMSARKIHFLNYLEERRQWEPSFNECFLDPTPLAAGTEVAEMKKDSSSGGWGSLFGSKAESTPEAASTPPVATRGEMHSSEMLNEVDEDAAKTAAAGSAVLVAAYHNNKNVEISYSHYYICGVGEVKFLRPEFQDQSFRAVSLTQNIWKVL